MNKRLIVNNGAVDNGASFTDGNPAVSGDVIYTNNLNLVLNANTPSNLTVRNDANAGISAVAGGTASCSVSANLINLTFGQFSGSTGLMLNQSTVVDITASLNFIGNGIGRCLFLANTNGNCFINLLSNLYTGTAVAIRQSFGASIFYGDFTKQRTLEILNTISSATINANISNSNIDTVGVVSYFQTNITNIVTINGTIKSYSPNTSAVTGNTNCNVLVNGELEYAATNALYPLSNLGLKLQSGSVFKPFNESGVKIALAEDTDPAPPADVRRGVVYNYDLLEGEAWRAPDEAVSKGVQHWDSVGKLDITTAIESATTSLNSAIGNLETVSDQISDNVGLIVTAAETIQTASEGLSEVNTELQQSVDNLNTAIANIPSYDFATWLASLKASDDPVAKRLTNVSTPESVQAQLNTAING